MNTLETIWGLLLDSFRILNMNCIHETGWLMTWKYFMSLQEAVTVFEDFTSNIKNVAKNKADIEEVKTLKKSIFEVAEAIEKFALNYSKRHLNETGPSERIFSPTMGEIAASKPVQFDSPMGCYKPNLYEMLSLNVIDSPILSICLIL